MINELIMLPTKNESKIVLLGDKLRKPTYKTKDMYDVLFALSAKYQHLYIVSDDEFKEGDWILADKNIIQLKKGDNYTMLYHCKKIIATTNPELLVYFDSVVGHKGLEEQKADRYFPISQIPKSFIKYFINQYNKGNKIEKVNVVYDLFWNNRRFKHQPFPDEFATEKDRIYELKINPNNTISIII